MKEILYNINPFKFIDFEKSIYARFYSIFDTIVVILSLVTFYYTFKIDFDSEISKSISNEFIDNFQTGYFLDFYKCSPNENRIKLDTWKGTLKGCGKIKDNISSVRTISDNDNCNKDEIVLEKIPPQNIYTFKGLALCGKTKGNYYDLLFSNSVVGENEECPKGKKNCGYIDTVKNKLCLDKESQCPVSYIQIKDIDSSPPDNITNLKVIKSEKIAFYYSNDPYANSSEIPYIQNSFKLAESEICSLPNLYQSNLDLYILDANRNKFSANCIYKNYPQQVSHDNVRYHEINTINQYELYSENKILDKIIDNHLTLYGYNIEKYKENTLNLYTGTHFGFNKYCLKKKTEFNMKVLTDMFSVSEKMNIWSKKIRFYCFFLFLFSLKGFINTNHQKINLILMPLFIILSFFLSFCMLYYTFFYGSSYGKPYKYNMECSDIVSNSNYNIMIKKLHSNANAISSCSNFLILIFGVNVLYVFILVAEKSRNDWFIDNLKRYFPNIKINSGNEKEEEKKL